MRHGISSRNAKEHLIKNIREHYRTYHYIKRWDNKMLFAVRKECIVQVIFNVWNEKLYHCKVVGFHSSIYRTAWIQSRYAICICPWMYAFCVMMNTALWTCVRMILNSKIRIATVSGWHLDSEHILVMEGHILLLQYKELVESYTWQLTICCKASQMSTCRLNTVSGNCCFVCCNIELVLYAFEPMDSHLLPKATYYIDALLLIP